MGLNVFFNGRDQIWNRVEDAPADCLVGDVSEKVKRGRRKLDNL